MSSTTTTRRTTADLPAAALWGVLLLAVVQAAVPVLPAVVGGSQPDESTVDLLITPAGYAFGIWGLIYALAIATAVAMIVRRSTGTAAPRRLLVDLAVLYAGAAAWIGLSAAELTWLTSLTLTLMTVVALDAIRVVSLPPGDQPRWLVLLTRSTVGIYAAWATAAVFQNWASDLGKTVADPASLPWQLALLAGSALVGVAVTARFGAVVPLYAVTLLWAFTAIVVTASGATTSVVVLAVVAMVAVVAALGWSLARARRTA